MFNPLFTVPVAMIALTQPLPTQIRIKIFPHLHNYAPMGKDADPSQVTLTSLGACKIFAGSPKTPASTGVLKSTVASLNQTLSVKSMVAPLWFECEKPITVVRRGTKLNFSYNGNIYARPVKTGPELIEVKPLNEYLKGVVPTEMPHTWPDEALKTQAIAARTYATFHILNAAARGMFYDVDDTVMYQAYTGNYDRTAATDAAVEATSSLVMTYKGKIIQAFFSADAGGYTEDASQVWTFEVPYCLAKPEVYPNAPIDPKVWGPWTVAKPLDDFNTRLVDANIVPASNPIVDLSIDNANRDESGRVKKVTLHLMDGTSIDFDGQAFHRDLGLKSTLFDVHVDDDGNIQVIGRGFGHGVGMGQYGARVLAKVGGWDVEKILRFYYTGIDLCEPARGTGETVCH